MAALIKYPTLLSNILLPNSRPKNLKLLNSVHFPKVRIISTPICCTKITPWEPSPVKYASSDDEASDTFLNPSTNIFETLDSRGKNEAEEAKGVKPKSQFQFLKWPLWLFGPTILLTTGMVPTLWLPLSSIFLGPNIASLLSLIGLDCIFNLGATLFLLMADACSRPKNLTEAGNSKPPVSYRVWNMVASLVGFFVPLMMLFGSENGVLQPQLGFISFMVLLGPYLLLLSVQFLTEMLTWHWRSPVWLVTPIVYEGYRVLQLMRGLKLGGEVSAPGWMMHMIRGLVCWWVLILGVQLMRVAWFAGFTARFGKQPVTASTDG